MSRLKKLREQTKEQEGGWQAQVDPTTYVKVSDIKTDPAFQHRAKVEQRVIDEYAGILKEGGELGAIKLVRDSEGNLWLWDGHQTLEAAKKARTEKLKAEIERGTKRDAWKKSLRANYSHGIRRNRDDLAKAIKAAITDHEIRYSLLNKDEAYTFTSVAKLVRTSRTSIRNYWEEYVPEIIQEIDEALVGWTGTLVSQKEIAREVARELHIPPWVVEERQIEAAFKLSQLDDEPEPAPPPANQPAPPPTNQPAPPPASLPAPSPASQPELSPASQPESGPAPASDGASYDDIGALEPKPPSATAIKLTSTDDNPHLRPQPAPSDNDSLFKRPRSDFKHAELPIYRWEPLRRAAASPEEIEDIITTIRMAGGSIMEVNDASELHIDAKIGKKREELPSLPDVWGGNTFYVIKLKVKK